jgi:hypothetical protein
MPNLPRAKRQEQVVAKVAAQLRQHGAAIDTAGDHLQPLVDGVPGALPLADPAHQPLYGEHHRRKDQDEQQEADVDRVHGCSPIF